MGDIKERGISFLPVGPKLGPLKSSEFVDTRTRLRTFLRDELDKELIETESIRELNYKPSRRERRKQQRKRR